MVQVDVNGDSPTTASLTVAEQWLPTAAMKDGGIVVVGGGSGCRGGWSWWLKLGLGFRV